MSDGMILAAPRALHRPDLPSPRGEVPKRALDVTVAGTLILVLLPLLLLLYVAVRLDGGAAIFGHRRVGQGGRGFRCWKFRSMRPDAETALANLLARDPDARRQWEESRKLARDPRVTPIGRFLRVSSLDELPQLWNVLRGDMSLVGPRPVTADELKVHYGRHATAYARVRPGITGPWQVSGRSDTSYEDRVRLDVDYARNHSLAGDISLLGRTVSAVLQGRGAR